MTYERQDWKMWQGEHKIIEVTVPEITGTSGLAATWVAVAWNDRSATPSIEKTSAAGDITFSVPSGELLVSIEIEPADTADLTPGQYYHELRVTDSGGRPGTVCVGCMTLERTGIPTPAGP